MLDSRRHRRRHYSERLLFIAASKSAIGHIVAAKAAITTGHRINFQCSILGGQLAYRPTV